MMVHIRPKNKFIILLFLVLSINFSLIKSAAIIPGINFPLMLNAPLISQQGNNLVLAFQLPNESTGLQYHEYIGVSFPKSQGVTDLLSDSSVYSNSAQNRFTCSLTDSQSGVSIQVSSQPAQKGNNLSPENNVLYCRLDDLNPLFAGRTYVLTLALDLISISNQFIRNVGIFTSTSSSAEKIIIDSLPVFGSLGLYSYSVNAIPALEITGVQLNTLTSNGNTPILYPYNNFDTVLQLTVNSYISQENSVFLLRYSNDIVGPPSVISSRNFTLLNISYPALAGQLSLSTFSEDSVQINGITQDLNTGMIFQLTLQNWTALDNNFVELGNLELWVYYKNTYSIQSISKESSVFSVTQADITFNSINHPENIDIYSTGAWPMQFQFTTNTDLVNGGFVVIQQSNTFDLQNKWIFSASTCDFSENNSNLLSSTLGLRPVCAPTQNGLIFENSSGNNYGSGIFFNLPNVLSGVIYTVTVWGYAESCGSSQDPTVASGSTSQFEFVMTIYKSYDPNYEGMERFTFSASNSILAQSSGTKMGNVCHSATTVIDYSNSKASSTASGDRLLYKEFNAFNLIQSQQSYTCTDPTQCYTADIRSSSTEYFLNSNIPTSNYFMLKADFPLLNSQLLMNQFPMGFYEPNNGAQPGRIQVQISKNYVTDGDLNLTPQQCILSWGFLVDNNNSSGNYAVTESSYPSSSSANYISSQSTMDMTNTYLPIDAPSSMVTITSNFDSGANNFNTVSEGDYACNTSSSNCSGNFVMYTNCLTMTSPSSPVKSIYSYFDVIYTFQYMKTSTSTPVPDRVVRFVKLYPEYGVFNDPGNSLARADFTNYHYAFGNAESNNAVCILEINGSGLSSFISANPSLNTLAIFLFNVNLLDIDYRATANMYPLMTQAGVSMSAYANTDSIPYTSINPISSTLQYSPSSSTTIYSGTTSNNMYMSSSLIINNPGSFVSAFNAQYTDLLIPTMCPYLPPSSTQYTTPIVTVQMLNIDNNNIISPNFNIYKYTSNNLLHKLFSSKFDTSSYFDENATLRFNRYSSTSSVQVLNIFNGNSGNYEYTGFSIFFSSLISVNNLSIQIGTTSITPYYSYLSFNIYVHGKAFNQIATGIYASGITVNASSTPVGESSTFQLQGVTRPTADSLYDPSSQTFITKDLIGIYCVSKYPQDPTYFTNYIYDVSGTSNVSNFILDFNTDNSNFQQIIYSNDSNDSLYSNDIGANFGASITLNSVVPMGSYFAIQGNSIFNLNSLCGIMNTINNKATTCNYDSLYNFSCPIVQDSNNFTICCYNVVLNSDISIDNISINFPNDNVMNISSYVSSQIYTASSQFLTWNVGYSTLPAISTLSYASITSINYVYVNHANGIGKAIIEIQLPRQLPRNARIYISGAFNGMVIPDVTPFCSVSTSNQFVPNYDQGDSILSSCSASNIGSISNSITISTKNEIYKCGVSFSNTIYLKLWPILTYNFNSSQNNNYSINILGSVSGEKFAQKNYMQVLPQINFNSVPSTYPLITGLWNNLGSIITIYPRIVEEIAYYDFEFDLFSNRYILTDTWPNEFSIFFPVDLFGTSLSNFECIYLNNNWVKINCNDDNDGLLTIRLADQISINDPNPIIRIFGIVNPGFDNQFLRLPCTANYIDISGQRTNLLTGGALIASGITNPPLTKNIGGLILYADTNMLSDSNPRSYGVVTLKVGFDSFIGSPPSNLVNPTIIVTFPKEFNFGVFKQLRITADITEWDLKSNNQLTKANAFNLPSIYIFKNSVVLSFNIQYFFSSFAYWVIRLNNIPAPFDTTMTSAVKVCVFSSDYTFLYKTYTNLNALATAPLPQNIDNFITSYKGFNYSYDNLKYLIDVTGGSQTNVIVLTPGIFVNYSFVMRPDLMSLPSAGTEISLTDDIFKLSQSSYILNSSTGTTSFSIGLPCSVTAGTFYVTFSLSNTDNFALIPPIKVIVNAIVVSNIVVTYDSSIPAGAYSVLNYQLSNLNFDNLSMSWINNINNDSSASIYSILIPPQSQTISTTFQIFNNNQLNTQQFTILDPNACFTITNNSIQIGLGNVNYPDLSIHNILIKNIANTFTYDPNFSSTLSSTSQNSLSVAFNPAIYPIFLSCAIECQFSDFLPDYEIINSNGNSDYAYKTYIPLNSPQVNIVFNNLLREQTYKVRCIIQTTQTQASSRQSYAIEIDHLIYNNFNYLALSNVESTACLKYTFSKDPGVTIRKKLVDYCQSSFASQGGCVVCVDNNGQTPPGLNSNYFYGCNLSQYTTTNYNQVISVNIPFGDPSTQRNYVAYTVCAVPDLKCLTDVGNSNYSGIIYTMMSNLNTPQAFANTLNLPVPPLNSVNIYSDVLVPNPQSITVSNIQTNKNGNFAVTLTNNIPLACFWMISPSSITSYSFDDIIQCQDSSRCGLAKVNIGTNPFTGDSNNIIIFTPGTYSIWLACFNDLPNPSARSAPYVVASFTIEPKTFTINSNFLNLNIWFNLLVIWLVLTII